MEQTKLGRLETWTYAGIWTGACLYSVYNVHLATDKYFQNYDDAYNDFNNGWSFLNRKIDNSDEEWKMWIPLLYKLVPWIIIHVFISQYLKKLSYNKVIICIWYILVSVTFLLYYFGLLSTLCTLLLPCISCLLTSIRSKLISWIVHSSTLAVIYYAKVSEVFFKKWLMLDDEEYFMLTTAICWIQLRSLSYSIDSIETYKHVNTFNFFSDLAQNISYCLYLPTLFLGPVILYEQFTDSLEKKYSQWNQERISTMVLNLVRYFFWMCFTNLALHYVYLNALKFHPEAIKNLEAWAFYGLGYCMGQYFLNKYVVIYGLTSTICRAEDIDAPTQPKCISRIHLYSDMWKYFDRGLYKFLLKYIYIPYNPKTPFKKFFASALTFTFIYLWHGMHLFIFIWAFLNFVGVTIETLVKLASQYLYKNTYWNILNPQNKQRLECALASPLLVLSSLSSFYFFAGEEIGHMYVERVILQESWKRTFILLFVLYCCCQTSTEIKRIEEKNKIKGRRETTIKKDF